MEADFCVRVLEQALARYGKPEIFNTDQGSQFTSQAFTDGSSAERIAISMDGRGCWRDNVFVERLWRSVKYEEVYLRAYETVSQAREGICAVHELLQHRAASHGARRQDAGQRVLRDAAGDAEKRPDRAAQCAVNTSCPPRRSCVRRKRRPPAAVDISAPQFNPAELHLSSPDSCSNGWGHLCGSRHLSDVFELRTCNKYRLREAGVWYLLL